MAEARMSNRVRRPGGRSAETSGRTYDAVMSLLVESGLAGCTFQAVAERASVNRSTLYRRWTTPAAMVQDAILARADAAVPLSDTGSLRADLSMALAALSTFLASPPGRAAVATAVETNAEAVSMRRTFWSRRWTSIQPIFQRAIDRGELDPGVNQDALIATSAGAVYMRLFVMGQAVDSAWIEAVLDRVLDTNLA